MLDPLMPLDERITSVSAAHGSGADQAMRHIETLHVKLATRLVVRDSTAPPKKA